MFSETKQALKQLESSDAEQQLSGLQLLQDRAQASTASLQQLLHKRPQCISAAVKLLCSSDSKVKKAAASFLACLAGKGAREKVCAEKGAVEGLAGLLGDSSAEVRMVAVHTLAQLLVLGGNSGKQVDRGLQGRIGAMPSALSALVVLLNSSSSKSQTRIEVAGVDVKEQIDSVSKVIDEFSFTGGLVRGVVGKLAVGLGLVDVLPSSSADLSDAAARLIACLAHNHSANQASIAAVPGAVSALLALLRSSHAGTALAGVDALIALSEGNLAIQETIGQQPTTFPALIELLVGLNSTLQRAAALALARLCSMARANAGRFIGCAQGTEGLLRLLTGTDARAAGAAAVTMVYLGSRGPVGQRMLEEHAAAVCTALGHLADPSNHPGQRSARLVVQALEGLAKDSTDFRKAMRASPEALGLLRKLHGSSEAETSRAAAAALESVLPGCLVRDEAPKPVGYPDIKKGSKDGVAARSGALNKGKDDSRTTDQKAGVRSAGKDGTSLNSQGSFHGYHGKCSAGVEVLAFIEKCGKAFSLPFGGTLKANLGGLLAPAVEILRLVDQARVNKMKALSLGSRVEALVAFLEAMFSSEDLLKALGKNPKQVEALTTHLVRLECALKSAEALLRKFARPEWYKKATLFVKANMYMQDIQDVESTINRSVNDMTSVTSTIGLAQTVAMRQELAAAAVNAAGVPLQTAQLEDIKAMQCDLTRLLDGQQELAAQLAAATAEERAEWAWAKAEWEEAKAQLSTMAAALEDIRDGVAGVAAGVGEVQEAVQGVAVDMLEVKGTMEEIKEVIIKMEAQKMAADVRSMRQSFSSTGCILSSRLILSTSRVKCVQGGPSLDRGTFASVYRGTFDGADVVIKQLDMTAFAGKAEDEFYREAAVLSQLAHHPCIVHFFGLVVDKVSANKHQSPALSGPSYIGTHDSAGSGGLSGLIGAMPGAGLGVGKAGPGLSVGLVMERCDMSLQQWLKENQTPYPLRSAVHICLRIAGGLKYLHEDAPITVVHADLKPANVLIKGAEIKLADFGLSHTIAINTMRQEAGGLMGGGGFLLGGTALWSAPELLEAWSGGKDTPHTPAGDIFALGLILYQLLAGRAEHPWQGELTHINAVKDAVMNRKRPSWDAVHAKRQQQHLQLQEKDAAVVAQVLKDLRGIVEACWHQDPEKRPRARDVFNLLEGVQLKLPVSC